MKALVTGGNGLLAHALRRVLSARRVQARFLSRDELDVTLPDRVREVFHEIRPDVVFHCAAYTAVDQAESEEATAIDVNGGGAAHVAESAREVGALLVFPSTDYVFDGTAGTPYPIDHPTGPKSAYGRSKLAGEEAVQRAGGRFLIARTSWLYGDGGKNFVDTMIRLSRERSALDIVADQVGRPTWTVHLAEALVDLAAGAVEWRSMMGVETVELQAVEAPPRTVF